MKKITILLFVFSCTISFSQKLYQDKTTIGIGTYVATNKSITETIQIEQVIIKNAKTSSHLFIGGDLGQYINGYEDNSGSFLTGSVSIGGIISERITENGFVFASFGTRYSLLERHPAASTVWKQNFFPFARLGIKRLWSRYILKVFITVNSDIDYNLYMPSPSAFVGEIPVPKKGFLGLGFFFGRYF